MAFGNPHPAFDYSRLGPMVEEVVKARPKWLVGWDQGAFEVSFFHPALPVRIIALRFAQYAGTEVLPAIELTAAEVIAAMDNFAEP